MFIFFVFLCDYTVSILFAHWILIDDIDYNNIDCTLKIGLRELVSECKDDDIFVYEKVSWGDCEDDTSNDSICSTCAKAGYTTGVFTILALCISIVALYLTAFRLSAANDSWALKIAAMVSHLAIVALEIVALTTFGFGCYDKISDIDYYGSKDGDKKLGPGFAAAIVVCIIQFFSPILHFFAPVNVEAALLRQSEPTAQNRGTFGMELERI